MKRILLIPSDHGGGRGHVSRCLYLAKTLQAQGTETAIVLEGKHYNDGLVAGIRTFLFKTTNERFEKYQLKKPYRPYNKLKTKLLKQPVFVDFSSLAYQIPRDGYLSEKLVARRIKQFDTIIHTFKPDVLIGDTHFLTRIIGTKHQIPVVQITRLAGFPVNPDFLWWKDGKPNMVEPDALGPFRAVLSEFDLPGISRAEDLLRGDQYIIPSSCELEPVGDSDAPVLFGGPLAETRKSHKSISFFNDQNEYPGIYVTIGGGAGRSQEKVFFEKILKVFDKSEFKVLVSTAGRVPAKRFKGQSANVVFADWVDGSAAIRQSDLVIHHGGYGTTMEVLLAGKPSIVIPSHTEQEGNGRRLEQLDIGRVIPPYADNTIPLDFSWTYGAYQMQAAVEFSLDPEQIFESTRTLLYGNIYDRLKRISGSLAELKNEIDITKF